MKTFTIAWGDHRLELGGRALIMGILNVTPDSFSDGGRFFNFETAVSRGLEMVSEGADMLDIGGESTRPFSDAVSAAEEMDRVLPVIEALAPRIEIPISIDTTKAAVAEKAIAAGASIINDVSALRSDPLMAPLAARLGAPVILMHMKGTPRTMQKDPHYDDLIGEIKAFLLAAVRRATDAGASASRLIIDPGIGFGKTREHNLTLLARLKELGELGFPILMGTSRKAFIRGILKDALGREVAPESPEVEIGTQASVAASILGGAHIVRVHDVKNTLATTRIIDAIRAALPS